MNEPRQNIQQVFSDFLRRKHVFSSAHHFLLAVSGGVDSAVLCELFQQSSLRFSIAHCNFKLRGEESERDERFVKNLAEKYGVQFYLKQFDTAHYSEVNKISIQEAARKLRYDWFVQLKKENGFSFIVTAHHADDNIETLLMNFFRGTGLQGLTGIPEATKDILRPMINIRRPDIIDFARVNHIKWIEDSSNRSSKYTRNFFRNELLPAIGRVYPETESNLLDNIARFKKISRFYLQSVNKAIEDICERRVDEVRIPIRKLKKYDYEILLFEIMKDFGFGEKQLKDIIGLMESESGKFVANDDFQVIRHGNWLVIAPISLKSEIIAIENGQEKVPFNNGELIFQAIDINDFSLQRSEKLAQLDAKNITFPLLLRKWKEGDYFYPLGMRKKKKLARFFIDRKLSKNQKENVWVVESNKKIIWVVGMRIDDRFRITENSSSILTITYQDKRLGS